MSCTENKKMNCIFILADDLGYMDVALNGSTYYETPNIQRLAEKGVTFTNAYAHPLCSPTRSALLTGQYPHRTMINAPACHLPDNREGFEVDERSGAPWTEYLIKRSLTALPTELYTIGEAFRDNGYRTALIGKHHLGKPVECQMKYRGFEQDLGMPVPGPGSYYAPYFPPFVRNPQIDDPWDNGQLFREDEHLTDRLAREADRFITQNAAAGTPFFLELWDFSVHAPFEAKKEYVEYFKKKNVPGSPQNGHFQMACMLKAMDDAVGRVLDSLERNNIADNTAVFFMGDNGGNMYDSIFGDFPTNNYPLRQGKGTVYEGGIRVPCAAYVPGVTRESSVVKENIHAVDFYPTFVELAGLKIDPARLENANLECRDITDRRQVLDGVSILPLLDGRSEKLDRAGIFTNFIANVPAPGNTSAAAVNSGKWKLIVNYETMNGIKDRYELYDLEANVSETVNLADKYPEKVEELKALIEEHQRSIPQAMPHKNPDYKADAPLPPAFRNWNNWIEDFKARVAADENIGERTSVVYSDETTTYYEKMRSLEVFKVGFTVCMRHGYDCKIDQAPQIRDGEIFFPTTAFSVKAETPFVSANAIERPVSLVGDLIIVGDGGQLTANDLEKTEQYLYSFALSGAVQWKPTLTKKLCEA